MRKRRRGKKKQEVKGEVGVFILVGYSAKRR
jgi:hypothetical protein